MTPLKAAARGARDFHAWAQTQGIDSRLLVDDSNGMVSVNGIFAAIKEFVDSRSYDQLVIFFSGHGILTAPGAEFWLLSGAPQNPNEAVNLFRSKEDSRNSGIPHIVFVSDACRSCVSGPPLSGVIGGGIFENRTLVDQRSEVDVFYATRPGDPSYEIPLQDAVKRYDGIFTRKLLDTVKNPTKDIVDRIDEDGKLIDVISSRSLKPKLQTDVPAAAAAFDVRLRQVPELQVETALPQYFAFVGPGSIGTVLGLAPSPEPPTLDSAMDAVGAKCFGADVSGRVLDLAYAHKLGFSDETGRMRARGIRINPSINTGFVVIGAKPVVVAARVQHFPVETLNFGAQDAWTVEFRQKSEDSLNRPATAVIEFEGKSGGIFPILPEYIGIINVEGGRVISLDYVPSFANSRHHEYTSRLEEFEQMKAFSAMAAKYGRFQVADRNAERFADRIRQEKGIDPTLGLYAAYAYAQIGRYRDVSSVFRYMQHDSALLAVPFDVAMLAAYYRENAIEVEKTHRTPFGPMLAQGWAALTPEHPLHRPIHERLRPHLIPSLWTTLSPEGVSIAEKAVHAGEDMQ